MLYRTFQKAQKTDDFDNNLPAEPQDNVDECVEFTEKYKFENFGVYIFAMPLSSNFKTSILTIERDGSNLCRRFEVDGYDFLRSRMTQVANALYAFAFGSPVEVTKISNFMDTTGPVTDQLQPLNLVECKGDLKYFSVSRLGDNNIILTGGWDNQTKLQ